MSSLINLIKALRDNVNDSREDGFSDTTQAMLASAVAFALPLPTTSTGSAKMHYNNTLLATVRKLVSEINELYLLDTEYVQGLIMDTYVVRYNFVHAPESSLDVVNVITQHQVNEHAPNNTAPTINLPELRRIQVVVSELMKQV